MNGFGAKKVITQHISNTEFCTYFVGYDMNNNGKSEYRWGSLIRLLQRVIPEFAFGHHIGESINLNEITDTMVEAAKAIYNIEEFKKIKKIYVDDGSFLEDELDNKYLRRGEFGELILHMILRDFHETVPLVSKLYFKDSYGVTVHGFDAIHIEPKSKTLWLGESKLYKDGKKGIEALVEDLKCHFNKDYLNDEFSIVSKKIKMLDNIKERDYWLDLMDNETTLSNLFNSVNIPLLCTYTSDLFSKYDDEKIEEFIKSYEKEVNEMKEHFDNKNNHPFKKKLNIILILFPVKCKDELVKRMHKKLSLLQEYGHD